MVDSIVWVPYLRQAIGARRFTGSGTPLLAGVLDMEGDIDTDIGEETAFGEGLFAKLGDMLMAGKLSARQTDTRLV